MEPFYFYLEYFTFGSTIQEREHLAFFFIVKIVTCHRKRYTALVALTKKNWELLFSRDNTMCLWSFRLKMSF